MKSVLPLAAMPLLLLFACCASSAHAQDGHEHHAPAAVPQEIPAQRYATDAPLRQGMSNIRVAVDALGHYERGHMDAEQAVTFATTVQEQIAYLIANCKLPPQADAALHGIIAELGAGAQALRIDPANPAAIATMRAALQHYSQQFNDSDSAAE